ncbi:MAG: hypothetical protein GY714_23100 [Desulfobacterales bacterium]|nr:hypothetical protein [Desulfobacterales bacterium]MCP4163116.1 hypothetical protein [Deltaproteobacteria bacterium]
MEDYMDEELHDAGEELFYEREYEKAIEVLNKALKFERKAQGYYVRGFCYFRLGEYRKTIKDMDSAIEIGGEKEMYFSFKGVSFEKLKDYGNSLSAYIKAVELCPSEHNFRNRALMYKTVGEYEKSLADFSAAIEISDDKSPLYVLRSGVYKYMENFDNVWIDLYRAVQEDPDHIPTYLDTMELYITEEKYKEGFQYIEEFEEKILEIGDERDTLLFLYLKATICICLNISIESFEEEIKDLAEEKMDLMWYFGHTRDWLENSDLRSDFKEKIEYLTDLMES